MYSVYSKTARNYKTGCIYIVFFLCNKKKAFRIFVIIRFVEFVRTPSQPPPTPPSTPPPPFLPSPSQPPPPSLPPPPPSLHSPSLPPYSSRQTSSCSSGLASTSKGTPLKKKIYFMLKISIIIREKKVYATKQINPKIRIFRCKSF